MATPLHDHASAAALVHYSRPVARRKHEQPGSSSRTPPTVQAFSALHKENTLKWVDGEVNSARRDFVTEREARVKAFSRRPDISELKKKDKDVRAQQRREAAFQHMHIVHQGHEAQRERLQQSEWAVASPNIGCALESVFALPPCGPPMPLMGQYRDAFPALVWLQHEREAAAARRGVNGTLREAVWAEQEARAAAELASMGNGGGTPSNARPNSNETRPRRAARSATCLCDLLGGATCPRCDAGRVMSRCFLAPREPS